ncbi:MAG: hypothetical protein GF364_08465 [Candidatus Lokiarchaeota archaeon]|nr:hypothetical protein [Candidatus Lokiarchaeota archaeon]
MQKEHMEKIQGYLQEKDINYHIKDESIRIPYQINDKKFLVTIEFHGNKWIVVSALIATKEQVPPEHYNDLLKDLLIANHELPEINYEINRDGDIYTSVDMRVNITDYDNFFSEFYAIPFGIKRFIEKIAPKFNIETKSMA